MRKNLEADIIQKVTLKTVWQLETYGMAKLIATELKAFGCYHRLVDGKKVLYILDGTKDDTVYRLEAEQRYANEFKARFGKASLMSKEYQSFFKSL